MPATLNSPLSSFGSNVSRSVARVRDWSELALIFAISGAVSSLKRLAMSGGGTASQKVLNHSDGTRWRPLVPVMFWMAWERSASERASR